MKSVDKYAVADFIPSIGEDWLPYELGLALGREVGELSIANAGVQSFNCILITYETGDTFYSIARFHAYYYCARVVRFAWAPVVPKRRNIIPCERCVPNNEYTCHVSEATRALAIIGRECIIHSTARHLEYCRHWFNRNHIVTTNGMSPPFKDGVPQNYLWTEKANNQYDTRKSIEASPRERSQSYEFNKVHK